MMDQDELQHFLMLMGASCAMHTIIRLVWGVMCPYIVGKETWDTIAEDKRYNLKFAPNMALNGLLAPLLVYPALERTPQLAQNGKYATVVVPRSPASTYGCAMATGYMAFDLAAMLIGYEVSVKANGRAMFHLYVWHHLLSILFWPVAILNNSFVYFVNWFVASETSSLWLAARGAMLTLKTINTPLGMFVQLAFVASFFLSRVVVMPDLVRSLVGADWSAVPGWQATLAATTVPIPFMLNVYWAVLILKSVAKVAFGGGEKNRKKAPKKA